MPAHPADVPGRHPDDEREVGNVALYDRSRANERISADRDAADDRAVGAQRRTVAHEVRRYSSLRVTAERGL